MVTCERAASIGRDMGRILCKTHRASGVVHVSSDIAADMKKDAGRLQTFRYDIDWLGDGLPDISYFVSADIAKQSGLPEPGDTPFGPDFEEAHATVFGGLVPVCEKCFDEYLNRTLPARPGRHAASAFHDPERIEVIPIVTTVQYPSLAAAFQAHPVRIADWGYMRCREADLAASGVVFFDDVEDPGTCRRAAFTGRAGNLIVLTIDVASMRDVVLFASDSRIDTNRMWRDALPVEWSGWIEAFDIVYFGKPT
jgi:hypothetical protein